MSVTRSRFDSLYTWGATGLSLPHVEWGGVPGMFPRARRR